jgi:hypothetical protein
MAASGLGFRWSAHTETGTPGMRLQYLPRTGS